MYDTTQAPEDAPALNRTGFASDVRATSSTSAAYLSSERVNWTTPFSTTAGPIDPHNSLLGTSSRAKSEFAKYAARASAAKTSPTEEQNLRRERAKLLNHKMREGLSAEQQTRLVYVRWNLDQIENARLGPSLDKLEAAVQQYKALLSEIKDLMADLDKDSRKGRRKK